MAAKIAGGGSSLSTVRPERDICTSHYIPWGSKSNRSQPLRTTGSWTTFKTSDVKPIKKQLNDRKKGYRICALRIDGCVRSAVDAVCIFSTRDHAE